MAVVLRYNMELVFARKDSGDSLTTYDIGVPLPELGFFGRSLVKLISVEHEYEFIFPTHRVRVNEQSCKAHCVT